MINSRYTIEYIEAESEKKKSSGFRSFFTFIFSTLVLSALGLFAYVAITGNTLPQFIQEPIALAQNYIKKSIKLPTSLQENTGVGTENIEITDESKEVANTTSKDNELIAQQEQILSLLAEKEKINNELKSLKQAGTDKAKINKEQLAENKAITAQLNKIKKQLETEKNKYISLNEQFEIQQVENETLATLLDDALEKTKKDGKQQTIIVENKDKPSAHQDDALEEKEIVIKEQKTKDIAKIAKSTEKSLQNNSTTETLPTPVSKPLEKVVSINAKEEESPPSDQEENQTELTTSTKTDKLTTDSKKSAVDAIIEAMKKTQSSN